MTPTLGRIVFFKASPEATAEPALIVTVLSDSCVSLVAWNAGGTQHFESSIVLDDTSGKSWSWPPRASA